MIDYLEVEDVVRSAELSVHLYTSRHGPGRPVWNSALQTFCQNLSSLSLVLPVCTLPVFASSGHVKGSRWSRDGGRHFGKLCFAQHR